MPTMSGVSVSQTPPPLVLSALNNGEGQGRWSLHSELARAVSFTKNTFQKKQSYLNLSSIISRLAEQISALQYTPQQYTCFVVQDSTPREILAPAYPDRLVHRLIVNYMEPSLDKQFINDAFANRTGKGHHAAVHRLQNWLGNPALRYFLKTDIHNFFYSIEKNILFNLLQWHIKRLPYPASTQELLKYLVKQIIFHNPLLPPPVFTGNQRMHQLIPAHKSFFNIPANKGLPLGNLTSQFFAQIYLNELDRFVKHRLKVRYYIRYVDDIILLSDSMEHLQYCHLQIKQFLQNNLHLTLHPEKTIFQPCSTGIDFLGYIVKKDYLLVRKRVVKAFKQKLHFYNHLFCPEKYPYFAISGNSKIEKMYREGKLKPPVQPSPELLKNILCCINSYYGILRFANTYKLRRDIYLNHFKGLQKYFYATGRFEKIGLLQKYL